MRLRKTMIALFALALILSVSLETVSVAAKEQSNDTSSTADVKIEKLSTEKKEKKYTEKQLRMMSCIIYCEAGAESYAGKLAVGIVIMNRKASSDFPDTIKEVIYQPYQFSPVRNGAMQRAYALYDAGEFTSKDQKACIRAAKEALNGEKSVTYRGTEYNMKSFHFFSQYVSGARLQIGGHMFK